MKMLRRLLYNRGPSRERSAQEASRFGGANDSNQHLSDAIAIDLSRALAAADKERLKNAVEVPGTPSAVASARRHAPPTAFAPETDESNRKFWNDLCGSQLAKSIGIVDRGVESLDRFDRWYLNFYPYLDRHLALDEVRGRRVLEIGLGYGTVAQRLAERGADYVGLDIAPGPVDMVRHRLSQAGLGGEAVQGSILSPPFEDASFDDVIAIGSLHHTGDLRGAIAACHRLLRPRGRLTFMVYYAYSYRQIFQNPREVIDYALREAQGYRGVMPSRDELARGAYDRDSSGAAAPHTDFISRTSLRFLCASFPVFDCQVENMDEERPFADRSRAQLLATDLPAEIGLDLYVTAVRS